MPEPLKYTDVLSFNLKTDAELNDRHVYSLAILGNISVHQSGDYLKYFLYLNGINAKVEFGNYDNIVQDSESFKDANCVVIFYELCNLIDGFQGSSEFFEDEHIERLMQRVKSEFDLICQNLKNTGLVIFNLFTATPFTLGLGNTVLQRLADDLNNHIQACALANFKFLNMDHQFYEISIKRAINWRDFYSAKILYTTVFHEQHAKKCSMLVASLLGKTKKALIFDCDNTLWRGIVGEDGVNGISIPAPFAEVQALALSLSKKGIIIGLCSKNDPNDVTEVFSKRADMVLSEKDILIKRINWSDKATNLREMARDLNIGMDSFVFVDDSSFECGLIKQQLPEVTVIKVPDRLYDYPSVFRDCMDLFYSASSTVEDKNRADMYRQEVERKSLQEQFTGIEEYLRSLQLTLQIFMDSNEQIARIAQLTQKTNQFNLTTRRYTESQIAGFIRDNNSRVFSLSVSDKFGDYGMTGLCIVTINNTEANIDSFLLSCRVIGRNVEFKFIDYIIKYLDSNGIEIIRANYFPTMKNSQTSDFWQKAGFILQHVDDDGSKEFALIGKDRIVRTLDYISLIDQASSTLPQINPKH